MHHPRTDAFMARIDALVEALDELVMSGDPGWRRRLISYGSSTILHSHQGVPRAWDTRANASAMTPGDHQVFLVAGASAFGGAMTSHACIEALDRLRNAHARADASAQDAAEGLRGIPMLSVGFDMTVAAFPRSPYKEPRLAVSLGHAELHHPIGTSYGLKPLQWSQLREKLATVLDHLAGIDDVPDAYWAVMGDLPDTRDPRGGVPRMNHHVRIVRAGSAEAARIMDATLWRLAVNDDIGASISKPATVARLGEFITTPGHSQAHEVNPETA